MAFTSAVAIFLGSFLLFLVQPVIGKMILPWFGGTPAVWTTCMLFFQVLLLAGYAYAALLARIASPVRQATIHIALLSLSLLLLPITPSTAWKPPDGEYPAIRILLMLAATVGWPYFLLSATSPLVQAWFARAYPTRSPYRLYALSNVGSLGALLLYPFVVEPALTTTQQGTLWSVAFVVFVLGSGVLAVQLWRLRFALQTAPVDSQATGTSDKKRKRKQDASAAGMPSTYDRWLWLLLPALASLMLLCITNHLCQDVAVIPFLWILPLAIYLLSLIICFDRDWWYSRRWFSLGAVVMILIASDLSYFAFVDSIRATPSSSPLWRFVRYDIRFIISVYLALFFLVCMVCHGEVVRRKPVASKLTEFYLSVSAGGALGGFIVAVVCPLIFASFLELQIGLIVSFLVAISVFLSDVNQRGLSAAKPLTKKNASVKAESKVPLALMTIVSLLAVFAVVSAQVVSLDLDSKIIIRNFYGTLKVREWFEDDPDHFGRAMYHGSILHGYQYMTAEKENMPTTYYSEQSGVGKAIVAKRGATPLKIGVVGLGVGTIAAYGQTGDTMRFYEINPLVIDLAKDPFTFLSKSPAQIEVVSGDARLSLERESPQQFDVLVLDAFSGDSIPVHLLTREAMEIYLKHMKPDGIIAIHVSNRYVNLAPVVDRLAAANGLQQWMITQNEMKYLELAVSEWILLAPSTQAFEGLEAFGVAPKSWPDFEAWTDDYNNLFELLQPAY
ncbi:MAG: fused MFS/spermidine synthase [Pirellulaceae bacterium]|nr:fused MFS/spermidine synthase [Pirellulaceae bacterium]